MKHPITPIQNTYIYSTIVKVSTIIENYIDVSEPIFDSSISGIGSYITEKFF